MSYLPRVKIVGTKIGVPGGNLQEMMIMGWEDEKGRPFEPTPPSPPVEDLTVDTPTETAGSTELGSTLTGTPATFAGGETPIVVKTRWERSVDDTPSSWANITEYQENGPTTYTTVAADNDRYLRFVTQATDNEQTVVSSFGNSIGPMVSAPLVVSQATKVSNGTFVNPGTVYSFETITCVPAVFTGGFGAIEERYRLRENTGSGWTGVGGWQAGIPTYDVSQSSVGDQLLFQSRATDATGAQLISTSPPVTVGTATTIGTLSVAPPATTGNPGDTINFSALISGDASPLYTWSIRNGPGTITSPTNIGQSVNVQINAGASSGDSIQVQVNAVDNSSSDNPQSTVSTIVVN